MCVFEAGDGLRVFEAEPGLVGAGAALPLLIGVLRPVGACGGRFEPGRAPAGDDATTTIVNSKQLGFLRILGGTVFLKLGRDPRRDRKSRDPWLGEVSVHRCEVSVRLITDVRFQFTPITDVRFRIFFCCELMLDMV